MSPKLLCNCLRWCGGRIGHKATCPAAKPQPKKATHG